jgi:hypothetical protein
MAERAKPMGSRNAGARPGAIIGALFLSLVLLLLFGLVSSRSHLSLRSVYVTLQSVQLSGGANGFCR